MAGHEAVPPTALTLEINAAVTTAIQVGTVILPAPDDRLRPAQLPRRPARFVGRASELGVLDGYLARPRDCSALIVHGRPGEGKTSLAIEAAHRAAGRYPDGHLVCEFRTHSGGEPTAAADVLARFLRDLGVAAARVPESTDERVAMYRSLTGGDRRLLVLLDDVRAEEDVRLLLPASPSSAVLVTSRATLSGLAADGARLVRLDAMASDDATTLLLRLADRGDVDDPDAVRRVVELCGRLPLAICVAGARLSAAPECTVAWLAEYLAEQETGLSGLTAGDRSVLAAFNASYGLLPEPHQRVLSAIGRVPLVSFTDESVAVLLGRADPAVTDWRAFRTAAARATGEVLDRLADLNLVDRLGPTPRMRYTLHDLIRRCCTTVPGDVDVDALMAWYRGWTRYAWVGVHADEPVARAEAWYRDEWENILVVADHAAATGRHETLWSLADSIYTSREVHTNWQAWRRVTEQAADAAQAAGDARERGLRTRLALAYREWRLFDHAIAAADRVIDIGRAGDDAAGMADGWHALGEIHRDRGDARAAARHYRRAIEVRRRVGDAHGLGWSLHGLGDVRTQQGDVDAAIADHTAALALFTDLADTIGQAWSWQGIGDGHRLAGRLDDAADAYTTAIALHRSGGSVLRGSWADYSLGVVRLGQGRLAEANELLARSYSAFGQLGQVNLQAHALAGLGDVLHRVGDLAAARRTWELARDLADPAADLHAELTERLLRSPRPDASPAAERRGNADGDT